MVIIRSVNHTENLKSNIMPAKPTLIICLLFCTLLLHCQEKFVTIGQQKYRIKVFGEGKTTVIFENGMSDSLEIWGTVPDSVARFARVFLYDRADIGKSDTSSSERTIPNVVSELKTILENQNIKSPYILVGHSLGGLITRYFSSLYPDDVVGLLLLDPAPESFWNYMSNKELRKYIKGGNEWYESNFPARYRKEWYQFIPNLRYMDSLNLNKDLSVILVSATAWNWYKYHEDILKGLNNTKHVELEGEHHIFKNHPDTTVMYIRELTQY